MVELILTRHLKAFAQKRLADQAKLRTLRQEYNSPFCLRVELNHREALSYPVHVWNWRLALFKLRGENWRC